MSHALEIRDLQVTREGHSICQVSELTVEVNEWLSIQGINGSGKSTLLRVLAGLDQTYQGMVEISEAVRPVGLVQQNPYLFKGTVLFNLLYGTKANQIPEPNSKARTIAQRLGIESLLERDVKHLSGGEKRRVALGRTLILAPKLLLLDEPFADMDDPGIEAICETLGTLEDSTIVIASPTSLPDKLTLNRSVIIG